MLRTLRRRIRIASVLPLALWAWKERHVLAGMAGFARTVPDRVRLGRTGEVALAAKVNLALLRDPRLNGADVRLGAVQGGDVCLEVGAGHEAAGTIAREVVQRVKGVTSVRLEDGSTTASAASTPSTVSGAGEVEAPTGDTAPVRV
jgi:hypothetical protein